jgi:hypothetical protein
MRRTGSKNLTQLATAFTIVAALSAVAGPARAQDDVTLSMARERFKEGVSYFDRKDFAKARVAFLQAYALKKHPAVLLNLAQSELRSGHEADAAQHFAQYLREHKDASDSERQSAETGLGAAKALVGEVALEVEPSGAEVLVDGESIGASPLPTPIFLAPGSHRILARKDGKTSSLELSVAAGQTTRSSLKLSAASPTPAPASRAEPSPTPAPESEPSPPEPPRSRQAFIPWVASTPGALIGVGLTGVGLIGGGAFSFGSKAAYDAADSVADKIADQAIVDGKSERRGACVEPATWLAKSPIWSMASSDLLQERAAEYTRNCKKYQDNVKSGDRMKTAAIVSFAVAGAAAVGTIVYYFVDSKESSAQARAERRPRVTVLPVLQHGFAGGLVSGSF